MLNGRDENLRKYFIKSANKKEGSPTETNTYSTSSAGIADKNSTEYKRVRILDRFGVILQIFAARA